MSRRHYIAASTHRLCIYIVWKTSLQVYSGLSRGSEYKVTYGI